MKMKRHVRIRVLLALLLLVLVLACSWTTAASLEEREDGLIISKLTSIETEDNYEYLTMLLKTGYGHEPEGKYGLNNLTNELVYFLLRTTSALDINYYPFAEYTVFTFVLWREDFRDFCFELDAIIRLDTLLLYDLCNGLIYRHYHTAKPPALAGQRVLYELLYGPAHPYLNQFKADYTKLNINEVNMWFREIYKPNNLIISTTAELPEDFLRKPSGRDLQKKVVVPEIPPRLTTGPAYQFTKVHTPYSTIFLSFPGPQPTEDRYFVGRLLQRYLQQQLWRRLRQELGYCYNVQVSFSSLQEPTAPNIMIAFQVLPENTEQALHEVFRLLEQMEEEPLTPEAIAHLIAQEEKYQQKNYSLPRFLSLMDAIGTHLGLTWAVNEEEYRSALQKITGEDLSSFTQTYLKDWSLSVAGPEPIEPSADSMRNDNPEPINEPKD
ncbi:MAG: insulinase family protein [Firmicutes bacterium]|nr:insulinase family protein [Bacillota bacterium]